MKALQKNQGLAEIATKPAFRSIDGVQHLRVADASIMRMIHDRQHAGGHR